MDARSDALSGSDHLIPLQSVQLMIINLVYVVVVTVAVRAAAAVAAFFSQKPSFCPCHLQIICSITRCVRFL